MYNLTARVLAKKIMDEIATEPQIPSTVGIGANLFLAKIALDTKNTKPDKTHAEISLRLKKVMFIT